MFFMLTSEKNIYEIRWQCGNKKVTWMYQVGSKFSAAEDT